MRRSVPPILSSSFADCKKLALIKCSKSGPLGTPPGGPFLFSAAPKDEVRKVLKGLRVCETTAWPWSEIVAQRMIEDYGVALFPERATALIAAGYRGFAEL
jgi:hypothetical protein